MRDSIYSKAGKRAFDMAAATAAIIGLAPVLVATAVAIAIGDGGSPLYRQVRSGKDEVEFTLYKFRSMPLGTDSRASVHARTMRITPVGRVIRRVNIDELPQLVNVLLGDMSIVGPRPALPSQVELLGMRRSSGAVALRPGLTGLAQINAYENMPERVKAHYDSVYAASVTLPKDLRIIASTLRYLLKPPPTY
ncbi:sugar transferase [Georgenia sp. 10Sc9-8]|uniref:Sugar transferase n=1 Tax=Georgenia halotolerans TaxID=3028317 RepID=A0ABT5TZK1_9MICO|nr:sugar transferase [Georgenia halotolerans]